MDFLGNSLKQIMSSSNHKNSNPIDLYYDNVDDFCEATSKVINTFSDSSKASVTDAENEKYIIEVLDYRCDSIENSITIFPESCKSFKSSLRSKNN
tara:strand:+ start:3157 stop:3444 length:288 start_codon:yes stop_codon:yes gene_type:complete